MRFPWGKERKRHDKLKEVLIREFNLKRYFRETAVAEFKETLTDKRPLDDGSLWSKACA